MEKKNVKKMTVAEMLAEFNQITGNTVSKFGNRAEAEERLKEARLNAYNKQFEKDKVEEMPHTHHEAHEHETHAEKQHENHHHDSESHAEHGNSEHDGENKKALEEMTDEEVLAAAAEIAEKAELTLEDANIEAAAAEIKAGKKRGRPAKEKAPVVELTDEELAAKKAESASKIAAGVASTWNDDKVRAARSKRSGCIVSFTKDGKHHIHEFESFAKAEKELSLVMKDGIKVRAKMKSEGVAKKTIDGIEYTFNAVEIVKVVKEKKEKKPKKEHELPDIQGNVAVGVDAEESNIETDEVSGEDLAA